MKDKRYFTQISYRNLTINVKITKNNLSKRIRLKPDLKNNSIKAIIPYYLSFQKGLSFVNEKLPWIYDIIRNNLPIYVLKQQYITLLDNNLRIKLIPNNKKSSITLINNIIIIQGNVTNEKEINSLLKKFIKNLVRSYITEVITTLTNKLGITYNRIFLKDNISRWGSCSTLKNISINWRLVFAPKEILNYIISHEVAHLIHFNHSKDFWDLVKKIHHNYKDALIWLKSHGYTLYKYKF